MLLTLVVVFDVEVVCCIPASAPAEASGSIRLTRIEVTIFVLLELVLVDDVFLDELVMVLSNSTPL